MSSVVNILPEDAVTLSDLDLGYHTQVIYPRPDSRETTWRCVVVKTTYDEEGTPRQEELFRCDAPTAQAAFDGCMRSIRDGKVAGRANPTTSEMAAIQAELDAARRQLAAIEAGSAIKPKRGNKVATEKPLPEEDEIEV